MTKRTKKKPSSEADAAARARDFSAIVDRPPLKLPNGARIVFWTIVNLEVWDIGKPMARQVLAPPTGVTQLARRAELELARIRHAGRRVALLRSLQAPQHPADARDQRAGLRGLRARRAGSEKRPLGVHGPLLRAGTDPQRAESESDDRALARRHRALQRQAAGGLARPGPDTDVGNAGPADGGRNQIYRRLGL